MRRIESFIDEAVYECFCLFPLIRGLFRNHLSWLLIVRIRSPKSLKASLRQVWRRWLLPNLRAGVDGHLGRMNHRNGVQFFGRPNGVPLVCLFFSFFWGGYMFKVEEKHPEACEFMDMSPLHT